MTSRVSTNTGHRATRQLPLAFGGNAVGTAAPNTLRSGAPSVLDAMGMSDHSGVVTVEHDSGAPRTLTVYYWNALINASNAAKGWIKVGPVAGINTASVDPDSAGSFSVPESVPIFISADAPIANAWLGGTRKHPSQVLADIRGIS